MLPDYIIFEDLRRKADLERDERPQLEVPMYYPYWPEPEADTQTPDENTESDQGVIIIQM